MSEVSGGRGCDLHGLVGQVDSDVLQVAAVAVKAGTALRAHERLLPRVQPLVDLKPRHTLRLQAHAQSKLPIHIEDTDYTKATSLSRVG